MTPRQIDEYKKRYQIEGYCCAITGKRATQIAHRISKTKTNIKIYGSKIIDHNFNLVPVCDLKTNDGVNIGNNPGKCKKLVNLINLRYNDIISAGEITRIINE